MSAKGEGGRRRGDSAGGCVQKEGDRLEMLMIEDRYGKWTLPKGKQEAGEEVRDGMKRNTGRNRVEGRIVRPLMTVNYQIYDPERGTVDKDVHYFLVQCTARDAIPQLEEISRLELEPEEVRERQQQYGYPNNDASSVNNWWNASERSCGDDGILSLDHLNQYAVKTGAGSDFGSDRHPLS